MRRIKIPLTVMIPSMSIIASKTKGIDRERYVYSLSGFNQVRIINTWNIITDFKFINVIVHVGIALHLFF